MTIMSSPDRDAFGYRERLDAFMRSLPVRSRQILAAYLSGRSFHGAMAFRTIEGQYLQPCWVYLPFWILETGDPGGTLDTGKVDTARDLAWAQLCLYYVFRIQDDLFDGHSSRQEMIFVANMFLDEAAAIFLRHIVAGSTFWDRYRAALRGSCEAMIVQRSIEQEAGISIAAHARSIRRLNAVLLVGAHAAARLAACTPDPAHIEEYGAAMGLAGQLLDDMADLDQDAREGRINFAARIIAHRATKESVPVPLSGSMNADLAPVARKIRSCYRDAENIASNFRFDGPLELAQQCRAWVERTIRMHGPAGLVPRNQRTAELWTV